MRYGQLGPNLKAQKVSAAQFVAKFASTIHDHDFVKGSLVLVCNSQVEKELTAVCIIQGMRLFI